MTSGTAGAVAAVRPRCRPRRHPAFPPNRPSLQNADARFSLLVPMHGVVGGMFFEEGSRRGPDGQPDAQLARRQRCCAFLRGVPVLHTIDESALWMLAAHATELTFDPGDVVIEEGEASDDFYIVRSGRADVLKRDRSGIDQPVARLGTGSYFGELGLLTNSARSATIRVCGHAPLRVYSFDAQTFHTVIAEQVLVFRVARAARRAAAMSGTADGDVTPGSMPRLRVADLGILDGISGDELALVRESAQERLVQAGSVVFEQGSRADRFYVLLAGEVAVERDGEMIGAIEPGGFFGETGLLLNARRSASVYATRPSVVWSIGRTAFQRVVCHYLLTNHPARSTVLSRITATPSGRFRT